MVVADGGRELGWRGRSVITMITTDFDFATDVTITRTCQQMVWISTEFRLDKYRMDATVRVALAFPNSHNVVLSFCLIL